MSCWQLVEIKWEKESKEWERESKKDGNKKMKMK